MSSVLEIERSHTHADDAYDHAINLVDSTKPQDEIVDDGDASSDSVLVSNTGDSSQLNRQWTRPHLRKELARRKYAKWQEEAEEEHEPRASLQTDDEKPEASGANVKPANQGTWGSHGRLRDKVPFRSKKKQIKVNSKDTTFIDVLYENQRGAFLCGIPLYSANSLLNLDPSGWQTATFQDSPVDITNAQVPDPSWVWDWRTWYVDMSHDVDEEGWEYSFDFSPKFAWHGNHPWFHSFCRRRRWLRKRVKVKQLAEKAEGKGTRDAHKLTADYFTIHAARPDRSRSTSGDRSTRRRSSTMAGYQVAEDDETGMTEIADVATLMTALKRARVDREKVAAVTQFLDQGGDELFYLADTIPMIMDDFIYQTSRRQMQHCLLIALEDAIKVKDTSDDGDAEKREAEERRVENLLKAINAAGVHINDQDYWREVRGRATRQENGPVDETHALDATAKPDVEARDDIAEHIEDEGGLGDEIKGISKDAEISVEPGIRRPNTESEETNEDGEKALDKWKGKDKA